MSKKKIFKSGFVTIVGRPNVGKSTLMNALLGEKLAIVSDKPQTTRNRITGILTTPEVQVIFLDTPGIHRHKGRLNEYMAKVARDACGEVDLILFMVEANVLPGPEDADILEFIRGLGTKLFLVINKVDLVPRETVLPIIEHYAKTGAFSEIIPVSSLKRENLDDLMASITAYLPEGPKYYPEDEITDQPERFIVAEIIREKIFRLTQYEVPYSTAVTVEEMKERGEKLYIRAVVYVEKDSQKGIIIGSGGKMLKNIGQAARRDIERLLGLGTYLDIWVKVKKDWREKPGALREMGYD